MLLNEVPGEFQHPINAFLALMNQTIYPILGSLAQDPLQKTV